LSVTSILCIKPLNLTSFSHFPKRCITCSVGPLTQKSFMWVVLNWNWWALLPRGHQ